MLNWLAHIDTQWFIFLNRQLQNSAFDWMMPYITEIENWRWIIGIGWLLLMVFGGKKGRQAGLGLILVITLSDQGSSSVLKPLVQRIRPCHVIENVHLLVDCSAAYSFPSSHAANMAAAAAFITFFYRKSGWIFYPLAVLVGFSRIYVGVHYPFDVLAGGVLGIGCALVVFAMMRMPFKSIRDKIKAFLFTRDRSASEH